MEKNSLSIPVAIVIAGIIIAGAVFFSNNKGPAQNRAETGNGPDSNGAQDMELEIKPVSAEDHVLGRPDAPVIIVEYSDTECPFCKRFHTTMNSLVSSEFGKSGKLAWVYRHFPLWKEEGGRPALHSRAGKEAEALECAGKIGGNGKFWEYTNRLYEITPANNQLDPAELPKIAAEVGLNANAFNACLSSSEFAAKVDSQYTEARDIGATGTPFSVIVASKPFDRKKISDVINGLSAQYGSSLSFFSFSSDNRRIGMSGSQPEPIVKAIIEALQ